MIEEKVTRWANVHPFNNGTKGPSMAIWSDFRFTSNLKADDSNFRVELSGFSLDKVFVQSGWSTYCLQRYSLNHDYHVSNCGGSLRLLN